MGKEQKAVKLSFSIRYIALVVMVAFISGLMGFFFNYLFRKTVEEHKSVKVIAKSSGNLVMVKGILGENIGFKLYLPSGVGRDVKSYFQYTIMVLNDGDVGIDDFLLSIEVNKNISLVKAPKIRTAPEKVKRTITFSQVRRDEPFVDQWKVSSLHKNELLEFRYVGYSEGVVESDKPKVVLRRAGWDPQYISEIIEVERRNDREQIPDMEDLVRIIVAFVMVFIIMLVVPFMWWVVFRR